MVLFNNLIMFNQHEKQTRQEFIEPELAESWSWNEEHTRLSFKLRQGVKWHDGKPFTSADVKCTWEMLNGKSPNKLRLNPRKAWYRNLDDVTTDGDYAVTFTLTRSQPAFLFLLAGGMAPVYPCHVPPAQMRLHPIGTGPFKLVEFKARDPAQEMQLTIDRKGFLDIRSGGKGQMGATMRSPPAGLWGLPPEILQTLPGYGPDIAANRAAARKLMEKHGYGPDKRLEVKVATRNIAQYRDPAVILIDQLKQIYIDGELDVVETANWFPKIARKDFMIAGNLTGSGADAPHPYFFHPYP